MLRHPLGRIAGATDGDMGTVASVAVFRVQSRHRDVALIAKPLDGPVDVWVLLTAANGVLVVGPGAYRRGEGEPRKNGRDTHCVYCVFEPSEIRSVAG